MINKILILTLCYAWLGVCAGTWTWQNPLPQGNDLRDLEFATAKTGWAIGSGGTIL